MYEIELKAHVNNFEKTKSTISAFAHFIGEKSKSDVYWGIQTNSNPHEVRIRIREETSFSTNGEKMTTSIVTYKKKELRQDEGNISYEVNDEKEFTISDRNAFETILNDTGFTVDLEKEKHVLQWHYDGVLLELCTISRLGNFLELEIIAQNQDDNTVHASLEKLQSVLLQCNIPLENIEKRYYSELLKEKDI